MRGAFLDKVCAWNLNYQTNVLLIIRLPSNFQHYTPMATNLIQFVFVFSSRTFWRWCNWASFSKFSLAGSRFGKWNAGKKAKIVRCLQTFHSRLMADCHLHFSWRMTPKTWYFLENFSVVFSTSLLFLCLFLMLFNKLYFYNYCRYCEFDF
jgi:hypothetical protein